MFNDRAIVGAFGIIALSYLPSVNALNLSWDVCTTDENGKKKCTDRISKSARVAIGVICLLVLLILVLFVICIVRSRRASAAQEKEYNLEASQMDGPPTIIATEYDPTSGPSGVYSGGQRSGGHLSPGRTSPQMSGPSHPVSVYHHTNNHAPYINQNHTAPHSQTIFSDQPYPFAGYSPRIGPPAPKSAFVSGGFGFPRPLLAGDRLKDRLKERPASVSSIAPILSSDRH